MAPTTTVNEFLEPSDGAAELHHVVATTAKTSQPAEGRFSDVEMIEHWDDFNIHQLSETLISYLSAACETHFKPSIRDLARVIFDERQLECFYLQTFIARVNAALLHAISPHEPGVTIIVCPGRFDGLHNADRYEPDFILPDWVVIQGNYSLVDASSMKIEDFVKNGTILAVGGTKLVRKTKEGDGDIVADTEACHKNYLAQLQYYSKTLSTRYAFLLSNKELVVVEFHRAKTTAPRLPTQRGLRSATSQTQLHSGLPSDFNTSDPPANVSESGESDKSDDSMHTPPPQRKRPPPSMSPESPLAYRIPPSQRVQSETSSNESISPLNSPPHISSQAQLPNSSQISSQLDRSTGSNDGGTLYTSSPRDSDVGVASIRSFAMPDVKRGI